MNFWRFDYSIINLNQQLTGHYDFIMVALSIFIMFIASLSVKQVIQSIKVSDTRIQRYVWIRVDLS